MIEVIPTFGLLFCATKRVSTASAIRYPVKCFANCLRSSRWPQGLRVAQLSRHASPFPKASVPMRPRLLGTEWIEL